jgi:catechol 2,3-dioxygenase-like lactoylglutathione lyase family enzyme
LRGVIKTQGLRHIHLVVRDIQTSLAFYTGVFGMQELFWSDDSMVFLTTPGGGDTITLNQDPALAERAGDNGGVDHFGFDLVDKADLDAAIAEVEGAGGRLVRRGEHAPGHPFAYCTDPDGYLFEL